MAAARACAMSMGRGEIAKEYLAVVSGWPDREEWTVDLPILRLGEVAPSRVWLKRAVHPDGAPSRTDFRTLKKVTHPEHGPLSVIHCVPRTGRTHQIRVHLSHSGHAVVGDKIYGPSEECYLEFIETGWTPSLRERLWLPRHALHSCSLELDYQGEMFRWESPLAQDLATWMNPCVEN